MANADVALIAGLTTGVLVVIGVVVMIITVAICLSIYHRHYYMKQNQLQETEDNTV